MIVVFSASERNGGILQFATKLFRTAKEVCGDAIMFVPDTVGSLGEGIDSALIKYKKMKSLNDNNMAAVELADKISALNPELVIFDEDIMLSVQVAMHMPKQMRTAMVIHDVSPHPQFGNIRKRLVTFLVMRRRAKVFSSLSSIILLSRHSRDVFRRKYPTFKDKTVLFPLGAHAPEVQETAVRALEESNVSDFFLFFGRLDKYKGIDRMIRAYSGIAEKKIPLVIAGGGKLDGKTLRLAHTTRGVVFLNRFIDDGEMAYLMKRSRAVILPYIEASQSGVLPIAYSFGKPVIASNIPGLAEYVESGKTGYLCNSEEELTAAMTEYLDSSKSDDASFFVRHYYSKRFNWRRNFEFLLAELRD